MVARAMGAPRAGRHSVLCRYGRGLRADGVRRVSCRPIGRGSRRRASHANPIVHIHGALFFIWTLYYFVQTSLVAAGRTPDHRSWGLAGISLGTLMAVSIVLATINSMNTGQAAVSPIRHGNSPSCHWRPYSCSSGSSPAAIAYVKRAEIHKRLMLVTMIPLMHAAMFPALPGVLSPRRARPGRRRQSTRCRPASSSTC